MLGMAPVPFPQVTTGWQRPPCARSVGRNSVNATGAPPSGPTPAVGPTLFSVVVANGPAFDGSAAGKTPRGQAVPVPPPVPPFSPPAPPVCPVVPAVCPPAPPVCPVVPAVCPLDPAATPDPPVLAAVPAAPPVPVVPVAVELPHAPSAVTADETRNTIPTFDAADLISHLQRCPGYSGTVPAGAPTRQFPAAASCS